MFEGIKLEAYNEGYKEGKRNGEVFAAVRQCPDKNGITYATQGDYMKAKVAFNAKDTEIADLKNRVKDLEKQIVDSSKTSGNHKDELAKYRKELERFYLEAIGNAKTVKQVDNVIGRFKKSPLFVAVSSVEILHMMDCTFTGEKPCTPVGYGIHQAATTKIKRINTKDTLEVCDAMDGFDDENFYAMLMAKTLKDIANIEVDMTKILDAKQKGLNARNVLMSMLSAYGVKADSVMEVK